MAGALRARLSVEIVFETHSTTTDNERGIATGWFEGELSERGREQAHELGERRRDDDVTAVFTSDLRRALETAEIAFDGSGIPVLQDWRLRECDYGSLNGMPTSRLDDERARRIDEPYPGGESYRQVVDRMRAFLDGRLADHDGGRVLLIGHSATRWALDNLLLGIPLEDLVGPFAWQEGWMYTLDRQPRAVDFAPDGSLLVSKTEHVPAIRRLDLASGRLTTLVRGR